jgi:hypothetical protein
MLVSTILVAWVSLRKQPITPRNLFRPNQISNIAFNPLSTPLSHLPLSSNSSPIPPFSFPFFASFALCTAPFLRASNGPKSFSRSATARFFSGSTRLRFAIWRSISASSCSFLESSESVGCSGRLSDGFEDLGCCDARRVATVASRFSISSGRAASCAVWSSTSSYPATDCQRV